MKRRGRPLAPLPMDEVAERYLAGESLRELGCSYRAHPSTIGRRLRRHGVQVRPPTGPGNPAGWPDVHHVIPKERP